MKQRRPTDSPLVPERIGRYEVLLPIASGGMGTVYLARTLGVGGFEREVAIKVMHAHLRAEEDFATDLIEEAKLASRIRHPNVVQVLDVGDDPHGVFLVMEYVEGDSLAGLQRACRKRHETLPERIGLRILIEALAGLHAAHELTEGGALVGLVHRDFSPQNVLVGLDGTSRLTDFGVAKASTRLSHTATGLVKGKIHYMAPEQARTDPMDRRADVWAAGVMAWEMLAGRRLYKDRNEAAILLKLITEPPARLRTVRADLPQALEDAVAHALATDAKARCPTARQLAEVLKQAAGAIGGPASVEEVGAYVRLMSGENLGLRREQIAEVVKLRKEISTIAAASTVDASELTTPTASSMGGKRALAPRVEEHTQVTQSSQSLTVTPERGTRRAWVLGIGGLAVAATVVFVFTREPPAEKSPAARPETPASVVKDEPEAPASVPRTSPPEVSAPRTEPAPSTQPSQTTQQTPDPAGTPRNPGPAGTPRTPGGPKTWPAPPPKPAHTTAPLATNPHRGGPP